ncbi:protein-L-isoaspartate(D-aspartate) O-methyltransferase [Rhodoferax sp.]|uniref:protein-L-isoaspartate(D-aspartate) O-methyltransferase n=1 Tax=Rhodoferax sp. TaxID=50421 RepID=UPI0025F971B2|nr:protein-L-isoaspartate(D-aspartate) O-methyltransferase [Rhodoferax sp.]
MKDRPSFPARLDTTLAQTRPHPSGSAVALGARAPAGAAAVSLKLQTGKSPVPGIPRPQGLGMDSLAVRQRMVQKLAGQGVTDPLVLSAMGSIERHRFVDSALVNQAYEDTSLPIGLGQTISKPGVVSRMIELLRNGVSGPMGRVLEIGTGCGYQAAVLSCVATEVYSIERLRGLHDKARDNLRPLLLPNVHLLFGDGMAGYAKGGPYSGIISAAGGDALPQAWVDQLAMGGRLVAPVVHAGGQALLVVDKTPQGLRQSILEAVHFVPLKSGVA